MFLKILDSSSTYKVINTDQIIYVSKVAGTEKVSVKFSNSETLQLSNSSTKKLCETLGISFDLL